jgi:hypothetical protein
MSSRQNQVQTVSADGCGVWEWITEGWENTVTYWERSPKTTLEGYNGSTGSVKDGCEDLETRIETC